ncbi:MAG TPA: DUF5916 domain-containing protein [Thermoanaerobaculia bacterium]|nr:DUF5916 domain-containing protein [Thermoanaerobaculia bacterium]
MPRSREGIARERLSAGLRLDGGAGRRRERAGRRTRRRAVGPGVAIALLATWAGLAGAPALEAAGEAPPPLHLTRAAGPITLDGDLSDPGWNGAAKIDTFYETSPGDNIPARVKTTVWLTYDERYFYIGVKCDDPEPSKIRAPFVDRDDVLGTDDNIAVFLDTRNDHRSAMELRVNPRGIQGDAMYNDANGNEDFSPDFYYDTAARITAEGWNAEYRIPFSSLRFPHSPVQTWGILVWRNYPREFRYAFHSSRLPRDSNCWICHTMELTGLADLPSSHHLVAAPYGTAQERSEPRDPNDLGSRFKSQPVKARAGLDVKWNPTADSALDATIKPDFSQVEADVPQISTNQRFALFFPEKRPFFLEGIDLFDTPVQAVYTRTITSPQWGARGTGKIGSSAYTLLVTEDRGGGLVTLPGPTSSSFAPQDFRSRLAIGRLRQDFGSSFGGFLLTDREIVGGGHNRVIGPDFQWRPGAGDTVTGQYLYSDTQTPNRPDLTSAWDGRSLASHASVLAWNHQSKTFDCFLQGRDYGDGFRADAGFVPQVGFRDVQANFGYRTFPEGWLRFVRPYATVDEQFDSSGRPLLRTYFPGVFWQGSRNLLGFLELHLDEQIRTHDRLLTQRFVFFNVQIDPSRYLSRIGLTGQVGKAIDFANGRVGDGVSLTLNTTLRPSDHLQLLLDASRQWLDVRTAAGAGRLFTAQVEHLKATYIFSSRSLLRLIAQYSAVDSNPALYTFTVPRRSGNFLGSLLYSYKLNWQTVLFVGYGDDRQLTASSDLLSTDRSFFLKISYAIQR